MENTEMKKEFESYTEMMMWIWTEAPEIEGVIWEPITQADNLEGDNTRYFVVGRV